MAYHLLLNIMLLESRLADFGMGEMVFCEQLLAASQVAVRFPCIMGVTPALPLDKVHVVVPLHKLVINICQNF